MPMQNTAGKAKWLGLDLIETVRTPYRARLVRRADDVTVLEGEGALVTMALTGMAALRDLQEAPAPSIDREGKTLIIPDTRLVAPAKRKGKAGRSVGTDDVGERRYALPRTPREALALVTMLAGDERIPRGVVVAAGRLIMRELSIDPDTWLA